MLTLELGVTHPPTHCDCCAGTSVTFTGFLYSDGIPRGVYFAGVGDQHADRRIQLAVGLGEWGDGTSPSDRVGFTMILRNGPHSFEVMLIDPEASLWNHVTLLGPLLSREAALDHPLVEEVFHVTDHLVSEDPRIRTYLDTGVLPRPSEGHT